jgi:hypothetical protein
MHYYFSRFPKSQLGVVQNKIELIGFRLLVIGIR